MCAWPCTEARRAHLISTTTATTTTELYTRTGTIRMLHSKNPEYGTQGHHGAMGTDPLPKRHPMAAPVLSGESDATAAA